MSYSTEQKLTAILPNPPFLFLGPPTFDHGAFDHGRPSNKPLISAAYIMHIV